MRFCIGAAEEIPESTKDADWNGQSSLVKWQSDKGVCVFLDSLSDMEPIYIDVHIHTSDNPDSLNATIRICVEVMIGPIEMKCYQEVA